MDLKKQFDLTADRDNFNMTQTCFLIWKYRFFDDRIEIIRNFFFEKCMSVSTKRIECASINSNIILNIFGRCNLTVISSSNAFTLLGIPRSFAEKLCERFTNSGDRQRKIRVTNKDLIKKSLLRTRLIWYFVLLAIIWAAVILFGNKYITPETADKIREYAFKRIVLFSALVMSFALPQAIIWLWAITGGVLAQFIKYYKYTATRTKDAICFEYGMMVQHKIYIPIDRIAIAEYSQSPLMQLFGCGELRIYAVGYNAFFMKSDTILPFLTNSKKDKAISFLLPEFSLETKKRRDRKLKYFIIHWTMLLPLPLLVLSIFFGIGWLIVALLFEAVMLLNALLLYKNSKMEYSSEITYISNGGFYSKSALIRNRMIESVSSYGTTAKKRHGLVNFSVKVFGKTGRSIRVRNISVEMSEYYKIPRR